VDETEHCVVTRYGAVTEEKAAAGLNSVMFSDLSCLPLTQQAFPAGEGGEDAPSEQVAVITADSVALTFDVAMDWHYVDAFKAFTVKRSHERVLQELSNGLRSGARDAGATISMASLFGAARAGLDEVLREAVQKQLGAYLAVDRIYIRGISMPEGIQKAWAAAATARAGQQQAKDQFVSDSLNIRRTLMAAEADARKTELANRAILSIPVEVRVATEMAKGLASVCAKASTCILGGSVMDTWTDGRRPR
jgi:hypothetical protein